MVQFLQDYDAGSGTISHANQEVVQNKQIKNFDLSWAKKQKLPFLHAIS